MEFVFLFVVVVAVIIAVYAKDKKRTQHAWQRIARELGLAYLPGGGPALTGTYKNHPVRIKIYSEGSGSSSQTYTGFHVEYFRSIPVDFQLGKQNYLQNFITMVGGTDIEIGDPDFDRAAVIKGRDEKAVREFLSDEWVRKGCLSILRQPRYTKVRITNRGIEVSVAKKYMDTSEVRPVLEHLLGTALQLENPGGEEHETKESVAPPPLPSKKENVEVPEEWNNEEPEEVVVTPPEPAPVEETVFVADVVEEETEEIVEEPPTEPIGIPVYDVAGELFHGEIGRYQAGQRFDALFKGETIRWSGTLVSVLPGESDRRIGRNAGWIALFDLGRPESMETGTGPLKVKCRIGRERKISLQKKTGREISFEGKLMQFDPFTSTLYIDSGDSADEADTKKTGSYIPYAERMKSEKYSFSSADR